MFRLYEIILKKKIIQVKLFIIWLIQRLIREFSYTDDILKCITNLLY